MKVDDVRKLSVKEIMDKIEPVEYSDLDTRQRLAVLKKVSKILDLDLSKEMLYFLLDGCTAKLIIATAGAGKTTGSSLSVNFEKITRNTTKGTPLNKGRVLYLVYNVHNVGQMKEKSNLMSTRLKIRGKIDVNPYVEVYTFHKFCSEMSKQFIKYDKYIDRTLLAEHEVESMFKSAYELLCKQKKVTPKPEMVKDIIKCYNICKENLTDYEDIDTFEQFLSLDLDKDLAVSIFNAYDKLKERRRKFDFTDMLVSLLEILQNHEDARKEMQQTYDYIIADEVQDLSRIMFEILRLVKGDKVPLLCIGDEDQSIYSFRGANLDNILKFTDIFEDGKVYNLATNRRCRKEIFEASKHVIEHNTLRYNKIMNCKKSGGIMEMIPYNNHESQIYRIIRQLKELPREELDETCICFRNRKSCSILADLLAKNNIPFHAIGGMNAYSHELFKHVMDILDMLKYSYRREYALNLYKILPFVKKADVYKAVGMDIKTHKWVKDRENKHFSEYDLGEAGNKVLTQQFLQAITGISQIMDTAKMKDYVPKLLQLMDKAFWNDKRYLNKNFEQDDFYRKYVEEFFSVDMTYKEFEVDFAKKTRVIDANIVSERGVTLSTFHKLKGLEFKRVIIMDLDDEIYPNFGRIDEDKRYTPKMKLELKEDATRLFFVAMTRAIDELYLYYLEERPSIYINWLQDYLAEKQVSETVFDTMKLDIGNSVQSDYVKKEKEIEKKEKPAINTTPSGETKEEKVAQVPPVNNTNFLNSVLNRF